MDMRMKVQLLSPGMQDGGKTIVLGTQSFIGGQRLTQSAGNRSEEQIVGLFGERAEKAAAQLCWQSEGDQEIGCMDEFAQFALNPASGGLRPALGAGFVVAGMISEMDVSAGFTVKNPTTQRRRAALSDRSNSAALVRGQPRSPFQEGGQKTT